jgi:hypothetical protein
MKKILLSLTLLLMASWSMANTTAADFLLDEQSLQTEMSALNQLEQDFSAPTFTTSSNSSELFAQHGLQQSAFGLDDMEWGPFAWGFCCWPVGFFVVAINSNKSKNEKLSFWIGTGVSVVLSAISSLSAGS